MPCYENTNMADGKWWIRHVVAHFKVHRRTVDRWLANPALAFPEPEGIINKRRLWDAQAVKAWRAPVKTPSSL